MNKLKNYKIIISKSNNKIHFYLNCEYGRAYLFSQNFSKGVYDWFYNHGNGRWYRELYSYKYNRNERLNKTVDKCLNRSYLRYAMEELGVVSVTMRCQKPEHPCRRVFPDWETEAA